MIVQTSSQDMFTNRSGFRSGSQNRPVLRTVAKLGRWLVLLALLGLFIRYAAGQAPDQEDKKLRAAQVAELERQRRREAVAAREAAEKVAIQARFAAQAIVVQQLWSDDQLERMVFQQDGNASQARQRLDAQLAAQIFEIGRICKLTDAQKTKLRLAGRGDIKRFFDRYEAIKQKSQAIEPDEANILEIHQELNRLQIALQGNLFFEDSLLIKSLPNTLTGDQFTRYETVARERRASEHRASVVRAVAILLRGIALRDAQRQKLITLLTNETKPARTSGRYDAYVLLLQLSRLPEEKLKRLFDEDQWEVVSESLAQAQQLEPVLRQSGQMPIEENDP
jgi:hypothetical protein